MDLSLTAFLLFKNDTTLIGDIVANAVMVGTV